MVVAEDSYFLLLEAFELNLDVVAGYNQEQFEQDFFELQADVLYFAEYSADIYLVFAETMEVQQFLFQENNLDFQPYFPKKVFVIFSFEVLGSRSVYSAQQHIFDYLLDTWMENKYFKPSEVVEQNLFQILYYVFIADAKRGSQYYESHLTYRKSASNLNDLFLLIHFLWQLAMLAPFNYLFIHSYEVILEDYSHHSQMAFESTHYLHSNSHVHHSFGQYVEYQFSLLKIKLFPSVSLLQQLILPYLYFLFKFPFLIFSFDFPPDEKYLHSNLEIYQFYELSLNYPPSKQANQWLFDVLSAPLLKYVFPMEKYMLMAPVIF